MQARRFQGLAIVAMSITVLGCGGNAAEHGHEQDAALGAADPHDHDHLAEGPHGGYLIELGHSDATAELTLNDDRHEVAVYLRAASETPMPGDEPTVTLQLFEDGHFVDYALTPTETADGGRVYSLVDKKAHGILDGGHVKGRLRVTWGDQEYSAPLDSICHGH